MIETPQDFQHIMCKASITTRFFVKLSAMWKFKVGVLLYRDQNSPRHLHRASAGDCFGHGTIKWTIISPVCKGEGIVQIGLKVWNLVHWYFSICSIQICREPKQIFNGAAILDDSKWPPVKNWFPSYYSMKSRRVANRYTFPGFFTTRNLNLVFFLQ